MNTRPDPEALLDPMALLWQKWGIIGAPGVGN